MELFKQTPSKALFGTEEALKEASPVTLCEGDNSETNFSNGYLTLTSHRLLWTDMAAIVVLSLELKHIRSAYADAVRTSEGLPRIVLETKDAKSLKMLFTNYGSQVFLNYLLDALKRRKWEIPTRDSKSTSQLTLGHGISAIEKKIQLESQTTESSLQAAFTGDLNKLMSKAQEMVTLSKKLAEKIREGKGSISEDETVEFKSVLLSMGISNPVTRETAGSETGFHKKLAGELATFLEPVLRKENGGTMSLADVYCRVNRARGVDMVSPDDLLVACHQFDKLNLPVKLRTFESGVNVVQLRECSDERAISETMDILESRLSGGQESLTAEQLAAFISISVTLARERLLLCESQGKLCRDETVEGLRFFPNLFLTRT